ncbi:glycine zipper domain-containing protein [Bremerella sp. JC817]|uniref:glycine zipper domain-containing protein n=1 Tax=Bremerella sp. JC817 TaxID=3231756 RepID=UPI0034590515
MRQVAPFILVVTIVSACSLGCRSPYHQDQLGLVGAGTGALAGAAIGSASGHTAGGAIIGGLVGATAGSAVGAHMDEVEARNQALFQQRLGRTLEGQTTYDDVIAMSKAGLSDQVITTHIRRHGMAQIPSAGDLIFLKNNGVSDVVISTMQNPPVEVVTAPAPRTVIVEEHHYGPYWGPDWHHHHYRHCRPRPGVHWDVQFGH